MGNERPTVKFDPIGGPDEDPVFLVEVGSLTICVVEVWEHGTQEAAEAAANRIAEGWLQTACEHDPDLDAHPLVCRWCSRPLRRVWLVETDTWYGVFPEVPPPAEPAA